MRDKDVINCLPSGSITIVPVPMVDAFVWITCICNAEASVVAKEEMFSLLL